MSDLATVRRRLEHVESTIETVAGHIDDDADSMALTQALGTLEQVKADLKESNPKISIEESANE